MDLERIVPAFFLISVLILILPSFLRSNSKKQFFKNLLIWSIIVVVLMVVSNLIF
jgi:hypothetical protein